ncbi:MAG: histidine kinase [Lachnospiraceae bacterium]|nr:histidine kinase [Lachnospiraceae bacterium]
MTEKSMNKAIKKILAIALPVLLAGICLMVVIINNNQSTMPIPYKVEFEGAYSFDGQNWHPYTAESDISARNKEVVFRGNVNADFTEELVLNFLCNHVGVSLYVNGECVYVDIISEIQERGIDLMPSMCGRRWEQLLLPKLSSEDEVEFHFVNLHKYGNANAYKDAMANLFVTPRDNTVLESYLKPYIKPFQRVGYGVAIVGVMLLGTVLAAVIMRSNIAGRLFKLGMISLFAGGYIVFDVMMVFLMDELLVIKTYGSQLCMMMAVYFTGLLIQETFSGKRKKVAAGLVAVSGITNIAILIVVICGGMVLYDTRFLWLLIHGFVCTGLAVLCVIEIVRGTGRQKYDYIYFLLMYLAILLDMIGIGRTAYVSGVFTKFGFLLVMILYFFRGAIQMNMDYQAAIRNAALQEELDNSRIAMMLSQIKPHFLYNVIGTIRGLCRIDSGEAWRALGDFSDYLRGNMSALSNSELIHFSGELRHIEAYLRLEKMRMGEELDIVYEIEEKDFFVPPLTIQPLVENAVKHGLFAKEGGGEVRLCSRRTESEIIVEVSDDGVGFDVNGPQKRDGHHEHIGLLNVRNRIEKMLGGSLFIESKPGKGTKVTVVLPVKRTENGVE